MLSRENWDKKTISLIELYSNVLFFNRRKIISLPWRKSAVGEEWCFSNNQEMNILFTVNLSFQALSLNTIIFCVIFKSIYIIKSIIIINTSYCCDFYKHKQGICSFPMFDVLENYILGSHFLIFSKNSLIR